MNNENDITKGLGQKVLSAMKEMGTPTSSISIVNFIAEMEKVHPKIIRTAVEEAIEGGVDFGFIEQIIVDGEPDQQKWGKKQCTVPEVFAYCGLADQDPEDVNWKTSKNTKRSNIKSEPEKSKPINKLKFSNSTKIADGFSSAKSKRIQSRMLNKSKRRRGYKQACCAIFPHRLNKNIDENSKNDDADDENEEDKEHNEDEEKKGEVEEDNEDEDDNEDEEEKDDELISDDDDNDDDDDEEEIPTKKRKREDDNDETPYPKKPRESIPSTFSRNRR